MVQDFTQAQILDWRSGQITGVKGEQKQIKKELFTAQLTNILDVHAYLL